ncbi:hypothetical protein OHB04_22875 [Streptomyces sp. NBC_01775]|uniref:hypothetical protein n=1 Tax=Streptomyces sp. NBC_01775 TaxID=2975939 RepID=UPI002DDC1E3A|nr:hypothetical protein [Streptomyces sp. NBC_01775]WSB78339.1 hypothetical protein OHB04_22875 [Streptomyces sp. NBC_01775]
MPIPACSLITKEHQTIDPGGYHLVHFPFGAGESYDAEGMHQMVQPDGYQITDWRADPRAGLIWPTVAGWGALTAMIQWEAGDYTELRDQVVRDPLGFTDDPVNTTATDHRPPSLGMQCFTKHHEMFVSPEVPLAIRVGHNDNRPRALVLAEFKLAIHT